jgi:menaquinone-dependent protoporphyrinogen oxidase
MGILIAFGSKEGGTQGLAEMLAAGLREHGREVDVHPAPEVKDLRGYDAVIVGGALYVLRWHEDARRFVRRHRAALRDVPVWLFSSGPLDDSALERDLPPVRFVRKAMQQIGAKGHVTFGGRMLAERHGLPVGDWRDPDQVRDFAKRIDEELSTG